MAMDMLLLWRNGYGIDRPAMSAVNSWFVFKRETRHIRRSSFLPCPRVLRSFTYTILYLIFDNNIPSISSRSHGRRCVLYQRQYVLCVVYQHVLTNVQGFIVYHFRRCKVAYGYTMKDTRHDAMVSYFHLIGVYL